jgi:hypothetical protein
LWLDAICTFDKLIKEETPVDKLMVIARTINIINEVFRIVSVSNNTFIGSADDELSVLIYVISKSMTTVKLYSNF